MKKRVRVYKPQGRMPNVQLNKAQEGVQVTDDNVIHSRFDDRYNKYNNLSNQQKALKEYDKWHASLEKEKPQTQAEYNKIKNASDSLAYAERYLPKLEKPTEPVWTNPEKGNVINKAFDQTPVNNPYTLDIAPLPWGENQEEEDTFRAWVNEAHPDKAKSWDFDATSSNLDNSYARSAYYELGKEYENSRKPAPVQPVAEDVQPIEEAPVQDNMNVVVPGSTTEWVESYPGGPKYPKKRAAAGPSRKIGFANQKGGEALQRFIPQAQQGMQQPGMEQQAMEQQGMQQQQPNPQQMQQQMMQMIEQALMQGADPRAIYNKLAKQLQGQIDPKMLNQMVSAVVDKVNEGMVPDPQDDVAAMQGTMQEPQGNGMGMPSQNQMMTDQIMSEEMDESYLMDSAGAPPMAQRGGPVSKKKFISNVLKLAKKQMGGADNAKGKQTASIRDTAQFDRGSVKTDFMAGVKEASTIANIKSQAEQQYDMMMQQQQQPMQEMPVARYGGGLDRMPNVVLNRFIPRAQGGTSIQKPDDMRFDPGPGRVDDYVNPGVIEGPSQWPSFEQDLYPTPSTFPPSNVHSPKPFNPNAEPEPFDPNNVCHNCALLDDNYNIKVQEAFERGEITNPEDIAFISENIINKPKDFNRPTWKDNESPFQMEVTPLPEVTPTPMRKSMYADGGSLNRFIPQAQTGDAGNTIGMSTEILGEEQNMIDPNAPGYVGRGRSYHYEPNDYLGKLGTEEIAKPYRRTAGDFFYDVFHPNKSPRVSMSFQKGGERRNPIVGETWDTWYTSNGETPGFAPNNTVWNGSEWVSDYDPDSIDVKDSSVESAEDKEKRIQEQIRRQELSDGVRGYTPEGKPIYPGIFDKKATGRGRGFRDLYPFNKAVDYIGSYGEMSNARLNGQSYTGGIDNEDLIRSEITKTGFRGRPKEWTNYYTEDYIIDPDKPNAPDGTFSQAAINEGTPQPNRRGRFSRSDAENMSVDQRRDAIDAGYKVPDEGNLFERMKWKTQQGMQRDPNKGAGNAFQNMMYKLRQGKADQMQYGGLTEYQLNGEVQLDEGYETPDWHTGFQNMNAPTNLNPPVQPIQYEVNENMGGEGTPFNDEIAVDNKRKDMYNIDFESGVQQFNAAANFGIGLLEKKADAPNQKWLRDQLNADNLYGQTRKRDVGDWDQLGNFRPDQQGFRGVAQAGGQMYMNPRVPQGMYQIGGMNYNPVETGEGILQENNFVKSKRKWNGKFKQKEISEKRFNRIQDRYDRRGGYDGGNNPNVDNTVHKRGKKSVSDMNSGTPGFSQPMYGEIYGQQFGQPGPMTNTTYNSYTTNPYAEQAPEETYQDPVTTNYGVPSFMQSGGNLGDEMYMSEEEIQEFINSGGELEFI